jgi:hypothetical protein
MSKPHLRKEIRIVVGTATSPVLSTTHPNELGSRGTSWNVNRRYTNIMLGWHAIIGMGTVQAQCVFELHQPLHTLERVLQEAP